MNSFSAYSLLAGGGVTFSVAAVSTSAAGVSTSSVAAGVVVFSSTTTGFTTFFYTCFVPLTVLQLSLSKQYFSSNSSPSQVNLSASALHASFSNVSFLSAFAPQVTTTHYFVSDAVHFGLSTNFVNSLPSTVYGSSWHMFLASGVHLGFETRIAFVTVEQSVLDYPLHTSISLFSATHYVVPVSLHSHLRPCSPPCPHPSTS